jgi:NAD(P)-dependent dehydrogenase (short-subunit alcohol dehydrogenase family)
MTQVVLPELFSQRSGHIVNITAALVDQPLGSLPEGLAAITKGGLNALTMSLAIELAKRGVWVNAVAPAPSRRRCTRLRPTTYSPRAIP